MKPNMHFYKIPSKHNQTLKDLITVLLNKN